MVTVLNLSGGKDSTALLLRLCELGQKPDHVVFFDGGWEFPQMESHLARLERYCGLRIERVYPRRAGQDVSFDFLLTNYVRVKGVMKGRRGYGWPHASRRWCTRQSRRLALMLVSCRERPYRSGRNVSDRKANN